MTSADQYWDSFSRKCRRAADGVLVMAILLLPVVTARPAQAQAHTGFTLLYSFTGTVEDGAYPWAGLIRDAAGNLYGTTPDTVFMLDTTGKHSVLYTFQGKPDGDLSYANLVRDAAGNLYGTTSKGGDDPSCLILSGCGTVFMLNAAGTLTVLHSFNGADGAYPWAGLIRDVEGNFYGTTWGSSETYCYDGCGTVFKLDSAGVFTVLHRFTPYPDGYHPRAGLIRDAAGNLYGTTLEGGAAGYGTVFKLDPAGQETVLHSFTSGADGANPYAGLIRDAAGNLYGTTQSGAAHCGTVFMLDVTGTFTVLHSFAEAEGCTPLGGLVRDAAGNLYGTTSAGARRGGTVFKLDAGGKLTVLHSFRGKDGATPYAGLTRDPTGNLYGTTYQGGAWGRGTVFKVTP